jgi:hypothetical protein
MSKLKVVIAATVIIWAGFESSQTATAAQFSVPAVTVATRPLPIVTNAQYIALAKKCTATRYRRPR